MCCRDGGGRVSAGPEGAATRQRRGGGQEARPGQAALLLHRPHHHGHPTVPAQEAHPLRDLRVHHDQVSLLPGKVPRLAELHPAQPLAQRLLHQDPPRAREPREGELLDAGPDGRGHVRQRELPPAAEAVQASRAGSGGALPVPVPPAGPAAAPPARTPGQDLPPLPAQTPAFLLDRVSDREQGARATQRLHSAPRHRMAQQMLEGRLAVLMM